MDDVWGMDWYFLPATCSWCGLAVVLFLQGVVLIRSRDRGGRDC